jgi:hypothetical protein
VAAIRSNWWLWAAISGAALVCVLAWPTTLHAQSTDGQPAGPTPLVCASKAGQRQHCEADTLQQTWSYQNSADYAPTYYLHSDAPLYYYSFTDAYLARVYQTLDKEQQARFDPMITGLNPADILDFAAEAGLVVILHNDIDMPFAWTDVAPVYLKQTKALLKRHPKTIIWAHTGLGRVVHPAQVSAAVSAAERSPNHLEISQQMLGDPSPSHVYFDFSWDEGAKYAVASAEVAARAAGLFNQYPERFLFGTDTVAPPARIRTLPSMRCGLRCGRP